MSAWSIIRVTVRQERYVADELRAQGVLAYAPMETTWAKKAKIKATRTRPLIPGYVFVHLTSEADIDATRAIRGFREFMCWDGEPRKVPARAIGGLFLADLFQCFNETYTPPKQKGSRYHHRFKAGDLARIRSGAFEGHTGLVLRARGAKRMEVLLTLFGRDREVVVEHAQLEMPEMRDAA